MLKQLTIFFFISLLYSCGEYTEFKEETTSGLQGSLGQEALTFENVSNKILKPHCISCHPNYNDFDTVKNLARNMVGQVQSNRMPQGGPPLNSDLKNLITQWVLAGTPAGDVPPPSDPVELESTWESLSQKVFFPKCVQCHNPNGQASFMDLSSRQKFFEQRDYLLNNFNDPANSYLVEVITDPDEPMPPVWSGIDRLSEEEVSTIIKWIEKGLP